MTIQAEQSAPSDRVDATPVDWLGDGELVPELQQLQRLIARAEARTAEIIALAHRRGVPRAQGFGSLTAWLIAATGDPPTVCHSRVRVALTLKEMKRTREAFVAGDLSECRVRLLVDAHQECPDLLRRDESLLVRQAHSLSARVFPLVPRHWARLADLIPIVLDGRGNLAGVGRRTRVVPAALRRALNRRDQHCTHPGYDVPARWCDAHHVQHWAQGGKTETANLRLLYRRRHRAAHEYRECPKRE